MQFVGIAQAADILASPFGEKTKVSVADARFLGCKQRVIVKVHSDTLLKIHLLNQQVEEPAIESGDLLDAPKSLLTLSGQGGIRCKKAQRMGASEETVNVLLGIVTRFDEVAKSFQFPL
ncbi:hypothetical protein SDC9_101078 [bioreactor metagenome]|uniref:Uncharacterized protein n=1 Tax=bioreactor metagenome TaxID=1076179 RepID=A0A645AMF6_9ZZZZ